MLMVGVTGTKWNFIRSELIAIARIVDQASVFTIA